YSSRGRNTRPKRDWSSDACSSDLAETQGPGESAESAEPIEAAELDSEEVSETPVASDAPEETFPTRTAVPTDELKFSSWPEWSRSEGRRVGDAREARGGVERRAGR